MQFPLDWQGIFDYVQFPAFLKPHDGGGWRDVYHVHMAGMSSLRRMTRAAIYA